MAESHNMKPNDATYGGFISLLKWSVPIIVVLVFLVLLIIT